MIKRDAFILIGFTIFAALVGEVFLRVFFPQPTYSVILNELGSYYEPSDFNTFTLKKKYIGAEPSQEFPGTQVKVTTNLDGFRGGGAR